MSVDIILKDIEWDGVNKIRVPLEGGGTQDFSIGGGTPTLQTKTVTYTPTTSQQTDAVTPDTGYDGLSLVNVIVNAMQGGADVPTFTLSGVQDGATVTCDKTYAEVRALYDDGLLVALANAPTYNCVYAMSICDEPGSSSLRYAVFDANGYPMGDVLITSSAMTYSVPSVTQKTMNLPTATKGTVTNHTMTIGVGVANSKGFYASGVTRGNPIYVSASELVSGTLSVTSSGTKDVTNYASASIPSGTEGTPTATKGTVSNHSVSVTPSVTNSAGYISGGTKTGNSVIVTATELASGNLPITQNADNINVVGYASVSVNVPTNLQTKTRTFTPTFSQQVEVIGPDAGYDGLNAVGVTVEAVQMMSLPRVASLTSTGTRRARIYQSNATQYWNIPEGYHTEAEYYEVAPLNVAPKIITANGDYSASDDDLDGYSSVSVNVQGGTPTLQTKSKTYTPNSSTQTDSITFDSGYDGLDTVNITINPVDPKLVTGTFTTGSTAGYTNINIPYTHNSYPIMCVVVVDGGAYKSGTDWYNSSQRYAIGQWTMTKADMSSVPTYSTTGTQNQGVTTWVYKNTSSTSYSRSSAMSTNVFSSNNASNSGANTIKLKSGNVLSYYVNTSSYGLHPNVTYRYFIVYK